MLRRSIIVLSIVACGCQKLTPPAVTQPASKPTSKTASKAPPAAALKPEAEKGPMRPPPSWIIFREAIDEEKDVACKLTYTAGRRLEVHTENARLLSLDVSKLPPGAPEAGPWNLQIDNQGIQITGLKGGKKVLDLVQSRNGEWSVVPGSHRTRL